MERKLCKRCGNWFVTRSQNTMCQYCISMTLGEFKTPETVPARKKRKKTQIEIDAKVASDLGLSYGYYIAWKEGRR